ncbi:ABC transporter substrate-binding protein [Halomonas llamarensis]|uniref:ABC transporter substrate-binding protein n=1 Tax=Halomonas llamarensis TaxID=2945104 RepID=A0ABT0SQR0_9GAMM|nr:ABC transporter substrate-binding protein [Halomonas llamarensis]MCL7930122.1 ABC transporter substrate-binding protein [Halomonas llamarensis]
MLRCFLRTVFAFYVLPLMAALSVTLAAVAHAEEPISLNSDVQLPDRLWHIKESGSDVPTTVIAPPEPLATPPLETVNVMLDWFLSPQHAPILLAKERGFFRRQGLEVQWQSPGDPSLPTKLLAAGEVDLALGRQSLLHLSAHQGATLIRIATLIETPLNAVITTAEHVSNAPTQNDLEALGTLHFGFTTREGEQLVIPGLVPHVITQSDEDALPPESLHFDAARALTEQKVQAVSDGFYHTLPAQLATEGMEAKVISYETLSIPRHDGLIVMANSQSLNKRADTWEGVVIALEDATNWMINNPNLAWETLITAYPVLDNSINANAWEDLLRRIALRPAALDTRRYRAYEAFLYQRGITDAPLEVEHLAIDPHER